MKENKVLLTASKEEYLKRMEKRLAAMKTELQKIILFVGKIWSKEIQTMAANSGREEDVRLHLKKAYAILCYRFIWKKSMVICSPGLSSCSWCNIYDAIALALFSAVSAVISPVSVTKLQG